MPGQLAGIGVGPTLFHISLNDFGTSSQNVPMKFADDTKLGVGLATEEDWIN